MLVFVYGTLRKGFGNHHLLESARFVGPGKTVERLTMIDLGAFPAVVRQCGKTQIVGEVYEVDQETLARLDRLEGFPQHYNRERFAVELDDPLASITPWMYFYDSLREGRYDVIASGDWNERSLERKA